MLPTKRRPPNFDGLSRGKGRNPGRDPSGAGLHKWWVELGGMSDIIVDAEKIRDELFRINLGMWNYAKNYNPKTVARNKYRELVWLNYVPGVRESRRLVGDYIMTQNFTVEGGFVDGSVYWDVDGDKNFTIGFIRDFGPLEQGDENIFVPGIDDLHIGFALNQLAQPQSHIQGDCFLHQTATTDCS